MNRKFLFMIITIISLTTGCGKPNYQKLENDFSSLAGRYYEEQLKGKVLGLNNHEVTLAAMEIAGYDISPFTTENCDRTSYSIIKLELNEDREVVGDYKIENNLSCSNYSTQNTNY